MICFDTSPVIWAVQGQARAGQEIMVPRTRTYLRHLSDTKQRVVVPSPVVSEYLVGFPPEEHADQLAAFAHNFYVPDFDMEAARLAAEIHREIALRNRRFAVENGVDWQTVKVDIQVVAIAIAQGCSTIVSHDPHVKKIGQGRIKVIEVPELISGEQGGLFVPQPGNAGRGFTS